MNERNGMYAVEVERLTRRFGTFVAVDDMSFKVKKGEIFGFLGPNGAGKSTTIRMLCGLLAPTSGKALVSGYDVGSNPDAVKATIGYMSQRFSLYDDLTVEENVNFYGGIYGLENDRLKERKKWAIEMAGLTGKEKSLARTLSGGWKQRLALGCAILHEPPIVFLDEPTGGVDPVSRRDFWDLIYSLSARGVTVFVTTHYLDEAEHCNTIGLIYNGKLTALGSPLQLKASLEKYKIFEVACDRPVDAMESLQKESWVVETSIFGSAFHVSTRGIEDPAERIREVLGSQGIAVQNLERIVPSLEDVFIHLISEEGAKASSPVTSP
ncbi:MAG: multidrug ABC transporter ATP-binding protein [Ignavibacteria bacterium GWA2_54_16]|nr:MAG: multidrug ABC transporter ATP-binding protein [Ignavibacteria bacterium GWA2_54_16]